MNRRKMTLKNKYKRKKLVKKILQEKWHDNSTKKIAQRCAFCIEANDKLKIKRIKLQTKRIGWDICDICLCPKDICDGGLFPDIMSFQIWLWGAKKELLVKDIPILFLNKIFKIFEKYVGKRYVYKIRKHAQQIK